jgi:hypothetical protein
VRGVVDVLEALGRQVGVHLRRGDVGVPEHLLQGAQVAAAREQVGGERVAQRVRAHPPVEARGAGVALDDLVEALAGQARPAVVDEEVALLAQADHPRAPVLQVGADRGDRVAADGHEPLLRALAPRAQDPRVEVDVADLEVDRLARAQPARVHELEQRPVAQGRGVAAGRGGEQARHLVAGEDLRELLGLARRAQVGGRVVLERPSRRRWR